MTEIPQNTVGTHIAMAQAVDEKSQLAKAKDSNLRTVYSRHPRNASMKDSKGCNKVKTNKVKPEDVKRGDHVAFRFEPGPEVEFHEDNQFWNHAIVLEKGGGMIKFITFCKCVLGQEKKPVTRDYVFESDCIRVSLYGARLDLKTADEVKFTIQQAEVRICDFEAMYLYKHEGGIEPDAVARNAEDMVGDTSRKWNGMKYTSEEFAFYAATKQEFIRKRATKLQLVKSFTRQNCGSTIKEVGIFLGEKLATIGLPFAIKTIISKVIAVTCKEATEEVVMNLVKMGEGVITKLVPKMAAACGAIMGGVGAAIGIVVETGFFAFKIARAIYKWKKKKWTKRQLLKYLAKEFIGFMTSAAGVVTSSFVCAIVGALIGGGAGIGAGIGIGFGIGGAFFLFRLFAQKITGVTFDKLMGPEEFKEVETAVETADVNDGPRERDPKDRHEESEFIEGMAEITEHPHEQ